MSKMRFAKRFDLFSKPFSFFIGKNTKKQTTVGGLLSLCIIGVSLSYLVYLLYLYFNNGYVPKLASANYNESNYNSIVIDQYFMQFQMIFNGQTVSAYEKQTGKKYINYAISYEQYYSDGTSKFTNIPFQLCPDTSPFPGFICIDWNELDLKDKLIDQYPTKQSQSNYSIVISKCQDSADCASEDEIENVLLGSQSYFQLYTSIEEYNTTTRTFQRGFKQDYFLFDIDLVLSSTISLIKSKTEVITGLFFQEKMNRDHVISYTKNDRYFSSNKILERQGYDGYAYIVFELDQTYIVSTVQFAMITEIISQFMGIFNILLSIGILAQILAESDIMQDVNSIFLKEYYKLTALQLIQKQKENIQQKQNEQNQETNNILNLSKKIDEADFIQKQKQIFHINFYQRLKIILLGVSHDILQKHKSQESEIYSKMMNQTVKRVDIYEVYRDLIKLKMAIQLILTKDQYAALQYCGCSLKLDDKPDVQINLEEDQQKIAQIDVKLQSTEQNVEISSKDDKKSLPGSHQKINENKNQHGIIQFDDDYLSNLSYKEEEEVKDKHSTKNNIKIGSRNGETNGESQFIQLSVRNRIIETQLEKQEDIKLDSFKNQKYFVSEKQKISTLQNHLCELDTIENNQQVREKYLDMFIGRIRNNNYQYLSEVDKNIFNSLIGVNQHQQQISQL